MDKKNMPYEATGDIGKAEQENGAETRCFYPVFPIKTIILCVLTKKIMKLKNYKNRKNRKNTRKQDYSCCKGN